MAFNLRRRPFFQHRLRFTRSLSYRAGLSAGLGAGPWRRGEGSYRAGEQRLDRHDLALPRGASAQGHWVGSGLVVTLTYADPSTGDGPLSRELAYNPDTDSLQWPSGEGSLGARFASRPEMTYRPSCECCPSNEPPAPACQSEKARNCPGCATDTPRMRLEFDRGTLLLRDLTRAADARSLPGVLWDPRVRQFRAPAHRYQELVREIIQRGCTVEDGLHLEPAPNGPNLPGWTLPPLRPYQQAALLAWGTAGRRGTLVLPTGSGKTRIACAAMAQVGASALCMVPTRSLLHQWRKELGDWYKGPIGCLGDGAHRVEPVTVTTFESAYRRMERLGDRFALLVVDEAHHFGRGVRDEALELAAAPLRLGLTATPDPVGLPRVADLIGPVVFELSIGDLAGRWLADFDLVVLRTSLTREERRIYDEELRVFRPVFRQFRDLAPEARWADFVAAASRSDEGRRALAAWRRARELLSFTEGKRRLVESLLERHRDSRTLVFTADNAAAYAIARHHLVMPITCDIGRAERERALAAFRAGELRTLVSARVLNEGIDVPDADVAIIVGGVQGEREHVQRIGRLLRPRPGKRALVYELVATRTSEERQSANRRQALGRASGELL